MNINDCYKTLECSSDISDDDLKKKYKELAKRYHPDIYKENPDKFKEINSAYQAIQDHKKNPFGRVNSTDESDFPFNINDIFSNFHGFSGFRQQGPQRKISHIQMEIELSFKESIFGVEKEIEFDRETKCDKCNGQGFTQKKNGCTHCDGFGQSVMRQGNSIFSSQCGYCRGKGSKEDCSGCGKKTFIKTRAKMKVNIPPGIRDKNIVQLQGAGHFSHASMIGEAYSNVLLTINVKNDTELTLEENDVIYKLNISLLEALKGCSKVIPTINGEETINIPSASRNKEEIIINGLGVKSVGNQRIILDVEYPENLEKIISSLEE